MAPAAAAAASVVGSPVASTAQPAGIGSPSSACRRIRPIDTSPVAMSRTSGSGRAGTAMATGFVPIMAVRPPDGWTRASLVVSAIPIMPWSATASA